MQATPEAVFPPASDAPSGPGLSVAAESQSPGLTKEVRVSDDLALLLIEGVTSLRALGLTGKNPFPEF